MQKKKLKSWDFITNKRLKYAKLINECLQFLLLIPFTIVLILSGIFYCKISAVDLIFGSISVFCFCILQKNIHRCLSLLYLFLFNAIMFLSFVIYVYYQQFNRVYEIFDLSLICDSGPREIFEFIFASSNIFIILKVSVVILIFVFFEFYCKRKSEECTQRLLILKNKYVQYICFVTCLISSVILLLKGDIIGIRYPRQLAKEAIWCHFIFKLDAEKFRKAREKAEIYLQKKQCIQKNNKNKVTCIFVLGESATAQAMHCYGYTVKNTPFLSQDPSLVCSAGRLILLQQCYSLNNTTVKTLHQIFSNSDYTNKLLPEDSILIYDICRMLGIPSYMISNQLDNVSSIAALETFADHTIFPYGRQSVNMYMLGNTTPPDEILLPSFSRILSEIDYEKDQLIVLHLYGSHIPVKNRFPKNFIPSFNKNSLSAKEFDYLCSIEYTDRLLHKISEITFEKLKERPYVICYVSDHGEDPVNKVGRGSLALTGNIPAFFDVPCAFFLSQKFCELYPEKVKNLEKNKFKPFVNEHIFDALVDILDVKVTDVNITSPEKNIFSNQYKQSIDDLKILDYKYPLRAMVPARHLKSK